MGSDVGDDFDDGDWGGGVEDAGADVNDSGAGGQGGSGGSGGAGGADGGDEDGGIDDGGLDDGGQGDGGTGGSDGGDGSCDPPNTCYTPTVLNSIRGDEGSDVVVHSGSTSEWISVLVREVNEDVLGRKLKLRATLASPPNMNFDLYLYRNASCGNPSASSKNYFSEDVASLSWGEGTIANGEDDDEVIHIEVRWVSGTCSREATWTLTVEGNT